MPPPSLGFAELQPRRPLSVRSGQRVPRRRRKSGRGAGHRLVLLREVPLRMLHALLSDRRRARVQPLRGVLVQGMRRGVVQGVRIGGLRGVDLRQPQGDEVRRLRVVGACGVRFIYFRCVPYFADTQLTHILLTLAQADSRTHSTPASTSVLVDTLDHV